MSPLRGFVVFVLLITQDAAPEVSGTLPWAIPLKRDSALTGLMYITNTLSKGCQRATPTSEGVAEKSYRSLCIWLLSLI